MDYEEAFYLAQPDEGLKVEDLGTYLRVQYCEHPTHIYRLLQPGEEVSPYTPQIEHSGKVYRLAWTQDDKW